MNLENAHKLHRFGVIYLPETTEKNSQPSLTDPTLACPVKPIYEAMINGRPLDISEHANIYNGVKLEDLSSIEKKHTDRFDKFIESRSIGKKFSKVATMVVEPADEK